MYRLERTGAVAQVYIQSPNREGGGGVVPAIKIPPYELHDSSAILAGESYARRISPSFSCLSHLSPKVSETFPFYNFLLELYI